MEIKAVLVTLLTIINIVGLFLNFGLLFTTLGTGFLIIVFFFPFSSQSDSQEEYVISKNGRKMTHFECMTTKMIEKSKDLLLSNVLFVRSKKPVTEASIRKALELICKRHPLLKCRVKENDDGSYIEIVPDMEISLETNDGTDWMETLENNLLEPYQHTSGPLWRATFLPNAKYESVHKSDDEIFKEFPHECACVIAFHHLITDGPSYSRLFGEILDYLNEIQKGVVPEVEPMDILPPMEYYLQEELKPNFSQNIITKIFVVAPWLMKLMIKRFMPKNPYVAKFGSVIQKDPSVEKRTCIIPLEFSREESRNLLKKCRENNTTIQGAAQTAASVVMAQFMNENIEETAVPISTSCTANVRPYIKSQPVPANYMGCYFSAIVMNKQSYIPKCTREQFWKYSASVTETLRNAVKDGSIFSFLRFFPILATMKDFDFQEMHQDPSGRRPFYFVFTNIGNCSFLDRDESSEVMLKARYGCSAEHNTGVIFGNNIISFNGKMFWTVIYYKNVTTKERAIEYAAKVKDILKMACE